MTYDESEMSQLDIARHIRVSDDCHKFRTFTSSLRTYDTQKIQITQYIVKGTRRTGVDILN